MTDEIKTTYKRDFLTNVIFRIDFPTILELKEKSPALFQSKINERFPILRESDEIGFEFVISDKNSSEEENSGQVSTVSKSWQFYNKEKNKSVVLGHNFIALEYKGAYPGFDEFFSDIELIVKSLLDIYKIEIIDRLGIRYVNIIKIMRGNPLDWDDLINESLTKHITFLDSQNLTRTIQDIRTKEENYELVFRYGIANSEYPGKISRKEFVLDFDCSKKDLESSEILSQVKEYHEVIEKLFEKSIEDKLRKIMNEEEESGDK